MTKQTAIKIAIFAALVIAFVLLYPYIKEYASLEFIKQKRIEFQEYYQDNKVLVLSVFFVGYVAVTALSLPGAAIMTLLAGALFGLAAGVIWFLLPAVSAQHWLFGGTIFARRILTEKIRRQA